MENPLLNSALNYAKQGWFVLPCREKEGVPYVKDGETKTPEIKSPYTSQGLKDATLDEDQIRAWWKKFPHAMIGVNAGLSGLTIVDIDTKNLGSFREDPDCFVAISGNGKEYKLPKTRLVTTISGGKHLYFSGVNKSQLKIDTGIDLLSEERYFITPPSKTHDGRAYILENNLEIVPFPQEVLKEFPKGENKGGGLFELPETLEQGGRNSTLFDFGKTLRWDGLTFTEIYATLKTINQVRCNPPLDESEVRTIAESASKKRVNPLLPPEMPEEVRESPDRWDDSDYREYEKYDIPEPYETYSVCGSKVVVINPPSNNFESTPVYKTSWNSDELLDTEFPPVKWIIPNLITEGLTILTGRPKVGKSWMVLQMIQAVGSGGMFFGEKVEKGKCLYLALEDPARRLQNRMKMQGFTRDVKFSAETSWIPLQKGGFEKLVEKISQDDYRLIIIDTLSVAFSGLDQNDQPKIQMIMTKLHNLSIEKNIGIILIDHMAKPKGNEFNPIDDNWNSTHKTGIADTTIGIYKELGKKPRLIGRGRDVEDFDYTIYFDKRLNCWFKEGDSNEVILSSERQEILNALKELGKSTVSTISRFIGKDPGNTTRSLNKLVDLNKVDKEFISGKSYYSIIPENPNSRNNHQKSLLE